MNHPLRIQNKVKTNSAQPWALLTKSTSENSLQSAKDMSSTTVSLSLLGSSSTSSLNSLSQSSFSKSRSKAMSSDNSNLKLSNRMIDLGLDLHKLETLLCSTSMEYCTDDVFASKLFRRFSGIATQKKKSTQSLDHDEWEEIADALNDLMCYAPNMPLRSIVYIHSTIGLIRQIMGRYDCAINAFTKAMFLLKKMDIQNEIDVGLLISRIGVAKSMKGNNKEGVRMLEKALEICRCAGLGETHAHLICIKRELVGLKSRLNVDSGNELSSNILTFHR
jgi:hypothetical protein